MSPVQCEQLDTLDIRKPANATRDCFSQAFWFLLFRFVGFIVAF
jgi:hypothetical protein